MNEIEEDVYKVVTWIRFNVNNHRIVLNRLRPKSLRECSNFWFLLECYDSDPTKMSFVLNAMTYGRTANQSRSQLGKFVQGVKDGHYDKEFFSMPVEWQAKFFSVGSFESDASIAGLERYNQILFDKNNTLVNNNYPAQKT